MSSRSASSSVRERLLHCCGCTDEVLYTRGGYIRPWRATFPPSSLPLPSCTTARNCSRGDHRNILRKASGRRRLALFELEVCCQQRARETTPSVAVPTKCCAPTRGRTLTATFPPPSLSLRCCTAAQQQRGCAVQYKLTLHFACATCTAISSR